MRSLRFNREIGRGVLFLVFGLGVMATAPGFEMGTLRRMGPGYFPFMLGVGLSVIGVLEIFRGAKFPQFGEIGLRHARALLLVAAAVVAFGLLIRSHGLFPALLGLLLLARLSARGGGIVEFVCIVAVMTAATAGIFAYGLGIPIKLGPW